MAVHIDNGAVKPEAMRTATAHVNCFDGVQGKLGRTLTNMGQLAAGLIENGRSGSVKAHVHQSGSNFRLSLIDKEMPNVRSYVVYPEGQYGQPLTTSPIEIGNTEVEKGTGKQNTVVIKLNPRTGEANMDADIAYGDYTQDPDSLDASIDTSLDANCEKYFPAGPNGTVVQDLWHIKTGSVFTSLKLQ
jgi:hypothetical protein